MYDKARGLLWTAGSNSLWYRTINNSSRLVSTQKGTVSSSMKQFCEELWSHLRVGQVNTEGEDMFHVSQAHRHPALPVTYRNQHFIVSLHISISDFSPFCHLCPLFLGEVYGNVFERVFGLRKIIDFISCLPICQTLELGRHLQLFVQGVTWT